MGYIYRNGGIKMSLNYFLENDKEFAKLVKKKNTLPYLICYWQNELFNFVKNLFEYENAPDSMNMDVFETELLLYGKCGVFYKDGKIKNGTANFSGVSDYPGYSKTFLWSTCLGTGQATDGVDGVVCYNNKLHRGIFEKINRYAYLLAHNDISIEKVLVNCRNNSAFRATSNKVAEAIAKYQKDCYEGKDGKIFDDDIIAPNVSTLDLSMKNNVRVLELWELRQDILEEFYLNFGIDVLHFKKGNMIRQEIESKSELLDAHITNLFSERISNVERINKVFGTNIIVKLKNDESGVNKDETETILNEQRTE